MIYHLLPELEIFSAYRGGAIARSIANMMRFETSTMVVCQSADDTWGFEEDRIIVLPLLHSYRRIPGRRFLPLWILGPLLRYIFRPLLSRLESGDIVWCHNQPFFLAALESYIHSRNAKLIYHSHDGHANFAMRKAFRSFVPDAYIFVSEFLRQKWLNLFPQMESTYVVHNGADEALFYPLPFKDDRDTNTPVILYVGRLHPEKGVHILMGAMRILQERKVDVVCKVAGSSFSGDSKASPYVKALLKSCPSNVQFEGYCIQTEIAKVYQNAHILCCPSIWREPFGNVNIEAMACGVPVVATRVGGIPEIAVEGGILLVEPSSTVALANALQALVEDKVLYAKMAAEGLASFQRRFTWTVINERYQKIANELLQIETEGVAD